MDKNLAEAIARLRGVTSNKVTERPSEKSVTQAKTDAAPMPPKVSLQNAAALSSLLAQAPDTPDADRQYTMEDLDNFLKTYINKD